MHRQSLGSPSSKLHSNGSSISLNKDDSSHIIASALEINKPLKSNNEADEEEKSKTHKLKSQITNAEKFVVHLIPVVVFLCIIVLFLFSYDPSQQDLAEFDVFDGLPQSDDLKDVEKIPGLLKIGDGGEVLGIQTTRILQGEIKPDSKYRLNRKIGHF